MPIPTQDQVDWKKPEEHFAWIFRNLPMIAGIGGVTHPGIMTTWSEHLVKAGAVHVDYLRTLADADGNIHVSKLPKQKIKWQPAFRGPHDMYNPAARWVPADAPDAPPMKLQDMSKLTLQEQHFQAQQLRELGVIPTEKPPQHTAEELNDGG